MCQSQIVGICSICIVMSCFCSDLIMMKRSQNNYRMNDNYINSFSSPKLLYTKYIYFWQVETKISLIYIILVVKHKRWKDIIDLLGNIIQKDNVFKFFFWLSFSFYFVYSPRFLFWCTAFFNFGADDANACLSVLLMLQKINKTCFSFDNELTAHAYFLQAARRGVESSSLGDDMGRGPTLGCSRHPHLSSRPPPPHSCLVRAGWQILEQQVSKCRPPLPFESIRKWLAVTRISQTILLVIHLVHEWNIVIFPEFNELKLVFHKAQPSGIQDFNEFPPPIFWQKHFWQIGK